MKKFTLLAALITLVFTLGTPSRGDAFCLAFCGGDVDKDAEVNVGIGADVDDSALTAGDGNTTAVNTQNSVVIGGNVNTRQSNFIGGIGVNRGDISQSNSANITGNQDTHIQGNDMRSFRGLRGNNNN